MGGYARQQVTFSALPKNKVKAPKPVAKPKPVVAPRPFTAYGFVRDVRVSMYGLISVLDDSGNYEPVNEVFLPVRTLADMEMGLQRFGHLYLIGYIAASLDYYQIKFIENRGQFPSFHTLHGTLNPITTCTPDEAFEEGFKAERTYVYPFEYAQIDADSEIVKRICHICNLNPEKTLEGCDYDLNEFMDKFEEALRRLYGRYEESMIASIMQGR